MNDKIHISANDYLRDAFRLARAVMDSDWIPDDLVALWRGGAPVGVAVHEFMHYHGLAPRHHVVKCHSYTGILTRRHTVVIDHIEPLLRALERGARVLVVDDIFDSGSTAQAIMAKLAPLGVVARFAAVYWKPTANLTELRPDYYVRETDRWIVFPHELDGLSQAEVQVKDPAIYALLDRRRLAAKPQSPADPAHRKPPASP